MGYFRNVTAKKLFACVAQHRAKRRIDIQEAAVNGRANDTEFARGKRGKYVGHKRGRAVHILKIANEYARIMVRVCARCKSTRLCHGHSLGNGVEMRKEVLVSVYHTWNCCSPAP